MARYGRWPLESNEKDLAFENIKQALSKLPDNSYSSNIIGSQVYGLTTAAVPALTTSDISSFGMSNSYPYTWTASNGNYNGLLGHSITGITSLGGTINAGAGLSTNWLNPPANSGTLQLNGEGADIIVNGVSLMDKLDKITERLNIHQLNPKLEAEWDQLKELGEQYRQLEAKLKEQGDMWSKLKAMPKPEL